MWRRLINWIKGRPKGEWVEKVPGKPPVNHIIVKVEDQIIRMPNITFK